jgi:hypothetical protein
MERWRAEIWAGWSRRGETRRGARWLARWSRGGGREIRRGDGVRVELYRRALLCRREGEGEQAQGRAQVDGRRRRALRVHGGRSAPAARRGRTKGGQQRRRGRWEGRRAAQVCSRLGKRPAMVDHARAAETEEIGDPRKKTRTDLQNLKSAGIPQ